MVKASITPSLAPSPSRLRMSRRRVRSHWDDWLTSPSSARVRSRSRSSLQSFSLVTVAPQLRPASVALQRLPLRGRALSTRAFHALTPVLLNSAVSVAVAWLTALCFSLGSVFSGLAPRHQSHRSFLIATLLWVHLFFCGAVWATRSIALVRLHLVVQPHRRAGAPRMLLKMLRRTAVWFVFSGAVVAAVGYACAELSAYWRQFRIELYVSSLWYYSFLPVADRAARHIFRNETVEGQQRRAQQQHRKEGQVGSPRPDEGARRRDGHGKRHQRWLSAACHGSTALFALIVPIVYVHTISLLGAAAAAHYVVALTIGSLTLKLVLQEAAKLYIVRRGIQNTRTMALLVAVPTVLIDTQVRIVLLRFQSVQFALSTTLALAVGEIVARVAKAAWFQRQIRRRVAVVAAATERSRRLSVTAMDNTRTLGAVTRPVAVTEPDTDASWHPQLLKYHATELCADMYAEYLAIGCSSAITVVFGHHPQFVLHAPSDSSSSSSSSSSMRVMVASLLTQVAVQVLVDAASCVAELASGLELAGGDARERVYFLFFFVALGIVNVNTSAILYLAY